MRPEITENQGKMVRWVVEYYLHHGIFPSNRDTQVAFGFASQTAVLSCWRALINKGMFQREDEGKARAVYPVWSRIIERAKSIWKDSELDPHYVHLVFQDGSEHTETYWLPKWSLVTLWLSQEKRNPVEIKIEKVKR